MTTQGLIYPKDTIHKKQNLMVQITDVTEGSAQRYSLDSIPNEVIEHNIFRYFCFQYWTEHFVSVCKRWKHICECSKIVPKHLRISSKDSMDLGRAILWVKKYQPTMLDISNFSKLYVGEYAIQELVGASERINTLITDSHDISEQRFNPCAALSRITTLVWKGSFGEGNFDNFPALQRLQIYMYEHSVPPSIRNIPLEELTIIIMSSNTNILSKLQHIEVPKLTVVIRNQVIVKTLGETRELGMDDMAYEQYFRYFGKTKLFVMLSKLDFAAAKKLLENSTSYEYETDLIESRSIGSMNQEAIRNYDTIFMNDYYQNNLHDPHLSSKLPVSDDVRFVYLVNTGEVEAAVAILAKSGAKIMQNHENSKYTRSAFFKLLSHPQLDTSIFDNKKVNEAATYITNREVNNYDGHLLKTVQQFDKIAALNIDWSETTAIITDYDLFFAMVEQGANIPYARLREQLLQEDVTLIQKIVKKLQDQEPSMWYDILSVSPRHALLLMDRYGISPMIEKGGRALWFKWILKNEFRGDDIVPIYINHMDSTGSTPLLIAIEYLLRREFIEEPTALFLLRNGADPNKYQPGKLSPLAALVSCTGYSQVRSNLILQLFKAGADINLTCMFKERMCSPLMIALLTASPITTTSLLIALGARTDYCDDKGRSIMDCVVEKQKKYEPYIKVVVARVQIELN